MPAIRFSLNERKAIAAARYLLSERMNNRADYLKLLKLVFLADRYHVRKYLRPVTSDRYFAMPHGPVASFLYNVFLGKKASWGQIKRCQDDHYKVAGGSKAPEYQYLSETDIEALDFAFRTFGQFDKWQLRDLVHAYPEWSKYSDVLKRREKSREEMSFEDFLDNADPRSPEFRKLGINDPYEPISAEERGILVRELQAGASQVI